MLYRTIVTTYFTVLTVYFRYLKSLPYTLQIFLDSVQLATHARLWQWLRRLFLNNKANNLCFVILLTLIWFSKWVKVMNVLQAWHDKEYIRRLFFERIRLVSHSKMCDVRENTVAVRRLTHTEEEWDWWVIQHIGGERTTQKTYYSNTTTVQWYYHSCWVSYCDVFCKVEFVYTKFRKFSTSSVAQRQSVGLITQRSVDRNHAELTWSVLRWLIDLMHFSWDLCVLASIRPSLIFETIPLWNTTLFIFTFYSRSNNDTLSRKQNHTTTTFNSCGC